MLYACAAGARVLRKPAGSSTEAVIAATPGVRSVSRLDVGTSALALATHFRGVYASFHFLSEAERILVKTRIFNKKETFIF